MVAIDCLLLLRNEGQMKGQNKSTAVMARRREPHDSLDYFPTPPWATRALFTHCIELKGTHIWEPACGDGHMSRPLNEVANTVLASDVNNYGWGHLIHDFLMPFLPPEAQAPPLDWIITNPPFQLAEQFVHRALSLCPRTAVLVRSAFAESVQRYESLFRDEPPRLVAQFVERVPMVKGAVDKDASSATAYCWMIWDRSQLYDPRIRSRMMWIPPCRSKLERQTDYVAAKIPQESWDDMWSKPLGETNPEFDPSAPSL